LAGTAITNAATAQSQADAAYALAGTKVTLSDSGWLTSGITAGSGWLVTGQTYRRLNSMVTGNISVTRTGSAITVPSTGNITNSTVASLPSGFYSSTTSSGMVLTNSGGPLISGYVGSSGAIVISAATSGAVIATNDTFSFTFNEMTD
jgi:hypothetical protein